MRKRVAYFDGVDAVVLTALICEGSDTIPIANGLDNHGQHARLINDQNRYDLVIAPLHKIYAPEDHDPETVTFQDIFRICRTYSIPLLVGVDRSLHDAARELLGDPPEIVRLVDPSDMLETARGILAG
ncbi:MAG: hypothetical protein OES57_15815 [Acidimicrobiia bacterium]|nr:hypothetical protein [Acidimicrobiia bacterium]